MDEMERFGTQASPQNGGRGDAVLRHRPRERVAFVFGAGPTPDSCEQAVEGGAIPTNLVRFPGHRPARYRLLRFPPIQLLEHRYQILGTREDENVRFVG